MAAAHALPLGRRQVLDAIRREAHPLTGDARDYDALIALIGDARIVLLGGAGLRTHEFYRERARITKRLIRERGFTAVAIEGDWPDAHRVNRYLRGGRADGNAEEALRGFRRFPTWAWRNANMLDLVGWLRAHNDGLHRSARKVGFYGLDLYSLAASIEAALAYLDEHDPGAAARALARYNCLEPSADGSAHYGRAVLSGVSEPCRRRVIEQLVELRRNAGGYLRRDGLVAEDEQFFAEQNAAVVAGAEEYYRTMLGDRAGSWSLRDRHMADTLDHLLAHLDRHGGTTRAVVWAHGELTIGRLMRERHAGDVVSVGFSTYAGTVTAASGRDGEAERKHARRAPPGSYEELLHATGIPAFLICPLGANAASQFDALVHIDRTGAVEPPETYPTAL
jgi:erythromycin esterase-like protein